MTDNPIGDLHQVLAHAQLFFIVRAQNSFWATVAICDADSSGVRLARHAKVAHYLEQGDLGDASQMKSVDPVIWEQFAYGDLTAAQAKKLGRKVDLRDDWDTVKVMIMLSIVTEKFQQNP